MVFIKFTIFDNSSKKILMAILLAKSLGRCTIFTENLNLFKNSVFKNHIAAKRKWEFLSLKKIKI